MMITSREPVYSQVSTDIKSLPVKFCFGSQPSVKELDPALQERLSLEGIPINIPTVQNAAKQIVSDALSQKYGYACVLATHSMLEASKNVEIKQVFNQAAYNFIEEVPLLWLFKKKNGILPPRIHGLNLMEAILKETQEQKARVFLYGGNDKTLPLILDKLKKDYPNLKIVGMINPPFRAISKEEDLEYQKAIRQAKPDILLVGIGCPRQEKWMAAHQNLPVMQVGLGAAFDFFSGVRKKTPEWIATLGLETTHRFIQDPKRLWDRYKETLIWQKDRFFT